MFVSQKQFRKSAEVLIHLAMLSTSTWLFASDMSERELIQDPHFQQGFFLLEPKLGKRVVYGELKGLNGSVPVWDLAQWSSRFPLASNGSFTIETGLVYSNSSKSVVVGRRGAGIADLSLAVNASVEYSSARKSTREPWVHLLVQQELQDPPALGGLTRCDFHLEARLKHSRLASTNDYSPALHAAQFLVYFIMANGNPKALGYQECFWFGIPVYDNRDPVVPAYEAQDFGDTKLFICTPSSAVFAAKSTHGMEWVTFQKDLLPLVREGLEHARAKGFIKGSGDLADFRATSIVIGWEVPGVFDADLEIRNLSLQAVVERRSNSDPALPVSDLMNRQR